MSLQVLTSTYVQTHSTLTLRAVIHLLLILLIMEIEPCLAYGNRMFQTGFLLIKTLHDGSIACISTRPELNPWSVRFLGFRVCIIRVAVV